MDDTERDAFRRGVDDAIEREMRVNRNEWRQLVRRAVMDAAWRWVDDNRDDVIAAMAARSKKGD